MLSRPLRRKRQKLSDVIVESVKRSIVTDALKPGDRLPTERELAEGYRVSRTTVRRALGHGREFMGADPAGGTGRCGGHVCGASGRFSARSIH